MSCLTDDLAPFSLLCQTFQVEHLPHADSGYFIIHSVFDNFLFKIRKDYSNMTPFPFKCSHLVPLYGNYRCLHACIFMENKEIPPANTVFFYATINYEHKSIAIILF